ncbi:MAG: molybdenum cofactor guanylyltransferase [Candidatus Baltobacteraceae bacterium]
MLGVLILAGGAARRFPGKLQTEFRGEPLVLRVFRNVRAAGPVYLAANRTFPPAIDAALECPVIVDRWPDRGPLAAIHTALGQMNEDRAFIVSADMPFVNAAVAAELQSHWQEPLDGVVPVDASGALQPLCAVYSRHALLEATGAALTAGSSAVKAALERMRITCVRLGDERALAGVNTPEEFVAVRTFDLGIRPRA